MVLVVMEKLWVGPVAKIMVGVQSALPTIQQCVLSLYVLLEDLIIVVTLRMDAVIMEEYDHAANQVGFNISLTDNMGNPKNITIIIKWISSWCSIIIDEKKPSTKIALSGT